MPDSSTSLICREDIDGYLKETLDSGADTAARLERTLPHAVDAAIRKTIEDRIRDVGNRQSAIKDGFIPVVLSYFARPDITSKSSRQDVESAIGTMPAEAGEVWKKAEAKGYFDSFTIVDAGNSGHFLIGKAGDKHFYIAGWL
jgi:hypothetical protein